jgi:hypothetical protein
MDELLTFEYFTLEDGVEVVRRQKIQKVIDVFLDSMQFTNAREPWVQGSVIIRSVSLPFLQKIQLK